MLLLGDLESGKLPMTDMGRLAKVSWHSRASDFCKKNPKLSRYDLSSNGFVINDFYFDRNRLGMDMV